MVRFTNFARVRNFMTHFWPHYDVEVVKVIENGVVR